MAFPHLLRQPLANLPHPITMFFCLPTGMAVPHCRDFCLFVTVASSGLRTVLGTQQVLSKRVLCGLGSWALPVPLLPPESPNSGGSSESWLFPGVRENSPADTNAKAGRAQLGVHRLTGPVTTHPARAMRAALRFREHKGTKPQGPWLLLV